MKAYEKIGWLDHVQDVETGEVIQEGTPVSQTNMNHKDDGIFAIPEGNAESGFYRLDRSTAQKEASRLR